MYLRQVWMQFSLKIFSWDMQCHLFLLCTLQHSVCAVSFLTGTRKEEICIKCSEFAVKNNWNKRSFWQLSVKNMSIACCENQCYLLDNSNIDHFGILLWTSCCQVTVKINVICWTVLIYIIFIGQQNNRKFIKSKITHRDQLVHITLHIISWFTSNITTSS